MTIFAPFQSGSQDISSNTWVDGATGAVIIPAGPSEVNPAWQFDLSVINTDTELITSVVWTVHEAISVVQTLLIHAHILETNLQSYSTSNPPTLIAATHAGVYEMAGVGGAEVSITLDVSVLGALMRNSNWQGRLGFYLNDATASASWFAGSRPGNLNVEVAPAFTGKNTTRRRMSRAGICNRCGTPAFREEFVMDGYTRGEVCTECWDPPDNTGKGQRKPLKEVNP